MALCRATRGCLRLIGRWPHLLRGSRCVRSPEGATEVDLDRDDRLPIRFENHAIGIFRSQPLAFVHERRENALQRLHPVVAGLNRGHDRPSVEVCASNRGPPLPKRRVFLE